jgi:hypothetical protein
MGLFAKQCVQKCMAFESSGFRMEKTVVGSVIVGIFLQLALIFNAVNQQAPVWYVAILVVMTCITGWILKKFVE